MASCVVSFEEFGAAAGVDKVVMVLSGASWDPACKYVVPFFVKAAASGEYPDLDFLTVDIDASPWCQENLRPGLNLKNGTPMLQAWRAGALLRTIACDSLDEVQRELEQYQVEAGGPRASKPVCAFQRELEQYQVEAGGPRASKPVCTFYVTRPLQLSVRLSQSLKRRSPRLHKRVSSSVEDTNPWPFLAFVAFVITVPFLVLGGGLTGITHRVVYYDAAAEKHWASGQCRVLERRQKTVHCFYEDQSIFYVGWLSVELVDEQQTFLGNFSAFKKPSFSMNCGGSYMCGRGRHCFNAEDNAKRFVEKYNAGQTYGCDYDPDHPHKIAMKNTGSGLMSHYIAGVFFLCFSACWCCMCTFCIRQADLEEIEEREAAKNPPVPAATIHCGVDPKTVLGSQWFLTDV